MSAEEGVAFWLANIEPLRAQGLRLGSPAMSSGPAGKRWLQDFFRICDGRCTVDFVALREFRFSDVPLEFLIYSIIPSDWYGTGEDAFIAHLRDYYTTFNRTLWVTEWACHDFVNASNKCSQEKVSSFMNRTQGFMDETDWVERYSWFGAMKNLQGVNPTNALLDASGTVNALGRQYIGATRDQPLESSAERISLDFMGIWVSLALCGLLSVFLGSM